MSWSQEQSLNARISDFLLWKDVRLSNRKSHQNADPEKRGQTTGSNIRKFAGVVAVNRQRGMSRTWPGKVEQLLEIRRDAAHEPGTVCACFKRSGRIVSTFDSSGRAANLPTIPSVSPQAPDFQGSSIRRNRFQLTLKLFQTDTLQIELFQTAPFTATSDRRLSRIIYELFWTGKPSSRTIAGLQIELF
jgi:hypothetical protein